MTNEERDLIARYIARVAGAQQGGFTAGSVPQSAQQLPPIDRDADAFIAQQFQQYPDARYRITQTALVQEGALAESQNQIRRLQWELQQTQQAMQQQGGQQQGGQQKGGFLSSIFGGGSAQPQRGMGQQGFGGGFQPTSPPPQPQYPPNYQPGMFQRGGGSGFLGTALTAAAGVAGGMVVGNALMGAFGGNHEGGGLFGGGGANTADSGSPWDGAGVSPVNDTSGGFGNGAAGGADPFASGGADKDFGGSNDPGFGGQDAGYDQGGGGDPFGGSGDAGGGFDSGGGGFDQS